MIYHVQAVRLYTEIYSNISHLQLSISPTAQQQHLHDQNICLQPTAHLIYTTGNLRQAFKNYIKKKKKREAQD